MTETINTAAETQAIPSSESDEAKLARIRAEIPALSQSGYFNAGTNGPLPKPAHQAVIEASQTELERGRIVPGNYEGAARRNAEVREIIASIAGCEPSDIALTHSTTEGIGAVLMGMEWQAGDEIVTTSLEHPGVTVSLALLSHRFGVKVRVAQLGNGGGDVVAAMEALITPRTKALVFSHLLWSSGAILPIADLAELGRKYNVMTVVDGAQAAGETPLNLAESGVDAYALPGQKWLCGPEGTGALYLRKERLADVSPTYLRYAQVDLSGYLLPKPDVSRFEIGEFYGPSIYGLRASLLFLRDEVNLDSWGYARIAALGKRCWDGISQIPGAQLVTPRERMAGLVNFNLEGWQPADIAKALYERGLTIRYVNYAPGPSSARVSCGWWNTEEEVDRLVQQIAELAAAGPATGTES
jgi:L-cysteine/cystine lyase